MNTYSILLIPFIFYAVPLHASAYPGQRPEDLQVTSDEIDRAVELRNWFEAGDYKKHVESNDKAFTFNKSNRTYHVDRTQSCPTERPAACASRNSNCAHEDIIITLRENNASGPYWGCSGNIGIMKNNQSTTACKPAQCEEYDTWYQNSKLRQHGLSALYEQNGSQNNVGYTLRGRRLEDTISERSPITHPLLRHFFMNKHTYVRTCYAYQKLFDRPHATINNAPRVIKISSHIEKKKQETTIVARLAPIAVCAAFVLRLSSFWQK